MNETQKIMVKVAISNRHVHFTQETYQKLFDEEISLKKPVGQIGEYAANQTVTIEGPKGKIENVRVMGPYRNYNQVEISKSDAYILGVNPPVRESGDLANSEDIIVIGPKGKIKLTSSCILAERHVHMNLETAEKMGFEHNDKVSVVVSNEKGGIMEAYIKVKPNGFLELHIDRDDANAFLLSSGDLVEIRK